MKLHRNAALSWNGRRLLVGRVVEDGWTVTSAAAAAGISVRCARKWVGRYRLEGEPGLFDRSSAPARVANRTAPSRVEAIAKLRRLRFTAAEIAELLGMALSTVSGILTRIGMGRLGRLGLEQPIRYQTGTPGRAAPHRHQTARPNPGRCRSPHRWWPPALQLEVQGPQRDRQTQRWLGIHPHRRRRLQPSGLRRSAPRPESLNRRGLPLSRRRVLQALRDHDRGAPDRQRRRLPRHDPRTCLSQPRHQTPPNPPLPAPNKRESRTLHPHNAQRLGLRSDLRLKQRTHAALDGWLWHYNHQRRHSALSHQPPVTRTNVLGSYT